MGEKRASFEEPVSCAFEKMASCLCSTAKLNRFGVFMHLAKISCPVIWHILWALASCPWVPECRTASWHDTETRLVFPCPLIARLGKILSVLSTFRGTVSEYSQIWSQTSIKAPLLLMSRADCQQAMAAWPFLKPSLHLNVFLFLLLLFAPGLSFSLLAN